MSDSTSHTIPNTGDPSQPLIIMNVHSVQKLTPSNYLIWRSQLEALLIGYDLLHFVDGSHPCPPKTLVKNDKTEPNPAYHTWVRQDKLLFGAIAGTLSPSLGPLITRASSSMEACTTLANTYANPSRTHLQQLKNQLKQTHKGSNSISEYIHNIKRIADELALLGHPLSHDDLIDRVLDGLGQDSDYQAVIDGVHQRDTPISFEALHEKLLSKELLLAKRTSQISFPPTANATTARNNTPTHPFSSRSQPTSKQSPPSLHPPKHFKPFQGKCQWCNVQGHVLAYCPNFRELHPTISLPPRPSRNSSIPTQANMATAQNAASPAWLLDSGASHHVTTDLANLSLHTPYDGTDEIVIGDGSGLPISHSGSTRLPSSSHSFKLSNVLCVISMHRNIISIYQFCRDNNVAIEFNSSSFTVKALDTGATLFRGPSTNGVYEWPSTISPPLAFTTIKKVD